MINELMSSDGVWMVIAAVLLPTIGGLWWYSIHQLSAIRETNASQTEKIERLAHDLRNIRQVIEYHDLEFRRLEQDINYLYWEATKGVNYEQSVKAKRPSNRQSLGRPQ